MMGSGLRRKYWEIFGKHLVARQESFASESQTDLVDQGKILIDLGQKAIVQAIDGYALSLRNTATGN